MALKVTCPNCGPRDYTEFWFGGEALSHAAPGAASAERLEEDFRRVWLKTNAAGAQVERWFHHAGCRRWLTIERDTLTNGFHGRA
ncbi:MAG: sarcosine oxidase subunit delta [Gemmatimonadaceae bacterium]|jgi:heterotetrameric sarcosine oxidase delta subunit